MASTILEFLSGSGISALPDAYTLGDLIPYILRLWVAIGIFSGVFRAFAAVFSVLLEAGR